MRPRLKPLRDQVIVITGATSGIGLSTARLAAQRGATVVLAARNETALYAIADEIKARGGRAEPVIADVGVEEDVRRIAQHAVARFGAFDTWINNAGVSTFGPLALTPINDQRRVFDTNYWGVVYGSLVAAEHFRVREGGGAIINLGSILSDMPSPLQATYVATKHAIKAFTNTLRMELMAEGAPVAVTLIKPAAIDTPYKDNARNYTDVVIKNPPPVYATPLVAQAILHAAEHSTREVTVGGGGKLLNTLYGLLPWLSEPIVARAIPALSVDARAEGPPKRRDNLHAPGEDGRERSFYDEVRESSLFTAAQTNRKASLGVAAVGVLALAIAFRSGRGRRRRPVSLKPVVVKTKAERRGPSATEKAAEQLADLVRDLRPRLEHALKR